MNKAFEPKYSLCASDHSMVKAIENFYCPPSKQKPSLLNKAGMRFEDELLMLETGEPAIYDLNTADDLYPILANHYSCQVNIFDVSCPKVLDSRYPTNYQPKWPQIYLLKEPVDSDTNHMSIVKSIWTYRDKNSAKQCLSCLRVFTQASYRHFCRSKWIKTCRYCVRTIKGEGFYSNSKTQNDFCDPIDWDENSRNPILLPSEPALTHMGVAETEACKTCNVKPRGPKCVGKHKCVGYYCAKCKAFIYASGKLKQSSIKVIHKCGERICTICNTSYKKRSVHHCPMTRPKFLKCYPNMGFLRIEELDEKACNCDVCTDTYTCDNHSQQAENEEAPIMATLYAETKKRGQFDQSRFYSSGIPCDEDDTFTSNYFKTDKLPAAVVNAPMTFDQPRIRFNQYKSKRAAETFLRKDFMQLNATEKALHRLMADKSFNNTSVMVFGSNQLVRIVMQL